MWSDLQGVGVIEGKNISMLIFVKELLVGCWHHHPSLPSLLALLPLCRIPLSCYICFPRNEKRIYQKTHFITSI